MTTAELHKILKGENKIKTQKDFRQILFELNQDTREEYCKESEKKDANNYRLAFYDGEATAFQLVLDLLDCLDGTPKERGVEK